MTKVVADITMSLDGFVTGPDPDLEHGLGRGGEPLHAWVESDHGMISSSASPVSTHWRITSPPPIIHLAPIVLGSGTPLLVDCHRRQLVQRDVRSSPTATHLTYALHN